MRLIKDRNSRWELCARALAIAASIAESCSLAPPGIELADLDAGMAADKQDGDATIESAFGKLKPRNLRQECVDDRSVRTIPSDHPSAS